MPSHSSNLDLIQRLEAIALRAWPALEVESLPGWIRRFSDGYTKRANSINGLDPGARLDPDVIDAMEAAYRRRALPPIWRITPLAPPAADGMLAARGYSRIDESLVQVVPLDGSFGADPAVTIASEPSPAWLASFAELSPVNQRHRLAMTRMLRSIASPVGFALVEDPAAAGQPLGFALGVVDGDHLGVFDMLVAPAARRRGLARRVLRSLCAWGHSHGARVAYLQVVAANAAAIALYADHGFQTSYRYWYRVP
jgi:ribosomal protein S18 acetylase RimI-like enzyme